MSCVVKKIYVEINEKRGTLILPNSLPVAVCHGDVENGAETVLIHLAFGYNRISNAKTVQLPVAISTFITYFLYNQYIRIQILHQK